MNDIDPSLKSHIMDYIESHLYEYAIKGLSIFSSTRTAENTKVTSSSGNSVTIIPHDMDIVVQIYVNTFTYRDIKRFFFIIEDSHDERKKYLVPYRVFHDDINAIEFKKVMPLNEFGADLNIVQSNGRAHRYDIYHDVGLALDFLQDIDLAHGDPRLDNIGYDHDNSIFVFFDYDKVSIDASQSKKLDDHRIFMSSLSHVT